MADSKKVLREEIRVRYMEMVKEFLDGKGEEILNTNSNEIAIPCLDSKGNDEFIVITFKVPTGSRDGEPYDGYGAAESYRLKVLDREEKAKKAAESKAKKIERDKKAREERAKAKAEAKAD